MDAMMINLAADRVLPILTYLWLRENSGPNSQEFREKIYDLVELCLDELGKQPDPPTRETVTRLISLVKRQIEQDQDLDYLTRVWS